MESITLHLKLFHSPHLHLVHCFGLIVGNDLLLDPGKEATGKLALWLVGTEVFKGLATTVTDSHSENSEI